MIEEQVIEWVNQIASLFGELAPEVWRILVTQSYVVGAKKLATGVIALIVAWRIGRGLKWAALQDDDDWGGVVLLSAMAWLVAGLFAGLNAVEALGYLINPEYYALMDVLRPIMGGS